MHDCRCAVYSRAFKVGPFHVPRYESYLALCWLCLMAQDILAKPRHLWRVRLHQSGDETTSQIITHHPICQLSVSLQRLTCQVIVPIVSSYCANSVKLLCQ